MPRLPQIGVPVHSREIKDKAKEIAEQVYGMNLAEFLRSIVEEVVETHGNLTVEQKVEYNLGNITIGGPRIIRKVLREWCRRNPEQARQLKMDDLSQDTAPADADRGGPTGKGKSPRRKA